MRRWAAETFSPLAAVEQHLRWVNYKINSSAGITADWSFDVDTAERDTPAASFDTPAPSSVSRPVEWSNLDPRAPYQ
jgi:hypothetical protein